MGGPRRDSALGARGRGFPGLGSLSLAGAARYSAVRDGLARYTLVGLPPPSAPRPLRPLGAQTLPLLTGVGRDSLVVARPLPTASSPYSRTVRFRLPALSAARSPARIGDSGWGVLEESERNSFFPSPPGGPGRARLGSPLSAPRGPWMARQQRSRGVLCPRKVHPADLARPALLPLGGGGSPRSMR